ncbi:MAG: cysteine desulfurase-like protein [Cyclobacteriaceae bacterium]
MTREIGSCRNEFPSLQRQLNGRSVVYLDGPAGTQVPISVIEAISNYYKTSNANSHGQFATADETDELLEQVRGKVAAFLGATDGSTISYGQNMTTLCYSLAKAIGRICKPGDQILITEMDHEANRGPWLSLKEFGVELIEVKMTPDGVLDYGDFASKISSKTKLVALGYASNLTGTINDVHLIRKLTKEVGAYLMIDAVHFAPHYSIDVQAIDCDFLICSAYKFYGPHVGLLYSKPGLLDRLPTDHLITQEHDAPYKIETGTLNHAAITGVGAAIDFLASFGEGSELSNQLEDAFQKITRHEFNLGKRLHDGLADIEGVMITGLPFNEMNRTPTVSFYHPKVKAEKMCKLLGEKGIFAWDGHFYAQRAVEVLGLLEKGGVTRLGVSLYTTEEEIDYTISKIKGILN